MHIFRDIPLKMISKWQIRYIYHKITYDCVGPCDVARVTRMPRTQAVCALGSQSIMGDIQNLIICVKMARSEHLAGSDCGDEYSLNTL